MSSLRVLATAAALAVAGFLCAPSSPAEALEDPVITAVPTPSGPGLVPGTPCRTTARACIDLSHRRTWLIDNGAVAYGPVPITSGRRAFPTPPGTFRVTFKDVAHKSKEFNDALMPNSVFFNQGIAFHQGSLKVPSHGCIHLSPTASRRYFAALKPGDVVQVVR